MIKLYNDDYKNIMRSHNIKCDLILTDPPYLYEKGGNSKLYKCEALERKKRTMLNSEFGKDNIYEFLSITKKCMSNPQWYIFCSEKQLPFYLSWCVENNYLFNVLIWEKQLTVLNRKRFSTNLEYIVRIYKWGCTFNKQDNNDWYNKCKKYNSIKGKSKYHPQQKPIELLEQFISFGSNEQDVVFDPFMGSGSTCVGCQNLNRNFIGIELDDKYFEIAAKRIKGEL